ncbi:MAG: MauE/DoxX family redox-associated membrane protein [Verrucomicrobiota bacterium]
MLTKYSTVIAAYVLSAVFLFSGAVKWMDMPVFMADMGHYQLMPAGLISVAAWGLVLLELGCGVAILFRPSRKAAAYILAGLLILFSLAILSAWFRGLNIECGCFGKALPDFGYTGVLIRNVVLLLLAGLVCRTPIMR